MGRPDFKRPSLTPRGISGMRYFASTCSGQVQISAGGLIDYLDEIATTRGLLLRALSATWWRYPAHVAIVEHLRRVMGRNGADHAMRAHGLQVSPPPADSMEEWNQRVLLDYVSNSGIPPHLVGLEPEPHDLPPTGVEVIIGTDLASFPSTPVIAMHDPKTGHTELLDLQPPKPEAGC